ncbi:hypothetical protein K0M31_003294 [Melipona bicolor]|uniref:Uncharacterized protein n=1 Tax=Melipona bicolor TaxID=60889 RepID=A0AA40FYN4_9HYME|nr:hypothetical protein K0M31_003294 [Melipona bicolor]
MDTKDFIDFGKATIDFVANYVETLREKNVLPDVEPRYLFNLLPEKAPQKPESWQEVLKDVERCILPGMTHWISPHFHAFYPTANSYPAIVGDILGNSLSCMGLSWIASPACTELEMIMMNWLGKLLGLPKQFLSSNEGFGGGVIQGSASEITLICLIAAREQTTLSTKQLHPELDEAIIKTKLVAYASDQSNSSVERGGLLASVPIRLLPTDDKCALRSETLLKAIKEDLKKGLIPCCVIANLGTTGTCAFDNLVELGPICEEYNMWLHIDAAYAGAAFACPEYRHFMSGIEYADSFNVNAHKWLKDSRKLVEACSVDRIYLKHDKQGVIPDYRNWQIPLGRRFRSLKVWFVLRTYGVEGIQQHIRHDIQLAEMFENYVKSDSRFELVTERSLSLVCFRMKGDNQLTQELINRLTARRKIYIIAATYREKLIARFVIGSRLCREEDVTFAWDEITSQATEILRSVTPPLEEGSEESLKTRLWQNQKV